MSGSLLKICNEWQIEREKLLVKNPDMSLVIHHLDAMIESSINAAFFISNRVQLDMNEMKKKQEPTK